MPCRSEENQKSLINARFEELLADLFCKRAQVEVVLGVRARLDIDVELQHLQVCPLQLIPAEEL